MLKYKKKKFSRNEKKNQEKNNKVEIHNNSSFKHNGSFMTF